MAGTRKAMITIGFSAADIHFFKRTGLQVQQVQVGLRMMNGKIAVIAGTVHQKFSIGRNLWETYTFSYRVGNQYCVNFSPGICGCFITYPQ